jgi:NAD(P)H-dependent flavin oxidoreductase YrpB (nitropropane dioxygenase family)
VGTRFVATTESEAHTVYIEALLATTGEDTVHTETVSVGWPNAPHRALRSCVAAAEAFTGELVAEQVVGDQRRSVPRFASALPTRRTTGAIAATALAAGEPVGAVQRIQPAGDIVRELADVAEGPLRQWSTTAMLR